MGAKQDKPKEILEEDEMESKAKKFHEEQKKKYGQIDPFFHEFDYNKDGTLDDPEFRDAIKSYIKVYPEKEKNMLELLDNLDTANEITLEEFRKIMIMYVSDDLSLECLVDVFKCMDKNMMGQIGAQEIKHVFSKLGLNITSEEAKELMVEADTDGDETLDFEEFLKIMISK